MTFPFEPYSSVEDLQQSVTDAFCELALQCIERKGSFQVSLSGGSTPKRVYEMLADRDLPWDKIHFYWGDERNVPADHQDSNYRMVNLALLSKIRIPSENVHPVPVNVEDPASAAAEYNSTLQATCDGKWDLVLLGMGDDAHTASLFPETKALAEQQRLFVENFVPKFDAFRYTMTYSAIAAGAECWFIITGQAKQDALQQVLTGDANPSLYPSQLIKPTRWFVDAAATQ